MNRLTKILSASLVLLTAALTPAHGQAPLPSGEYRFTAPLGPILLDGRYPLLLSGVPMGSAELLTSPQGAVLGTIEILGSGRVPVKGTIAVREKTVRLLLNGKSELGSFSANCSLQGSVFVGTFKLRGKKLPAAIDVFGISPLLADYALNLETDAKGRVTGSGTISAGRGSIAVVATGKSSTRKVTLSVRGGKTVWQASGVPPQLGSFEVDWAGARLRRGSQRARPAGLFLRTRVISRLDQRHHRRIKTGNSAAPSAALSRVRRQGCDRRL